MGTRIHTPLALFVPALVILMFQPGHAAAFRGPGQHETFQPASPDRGWGQRSDDDEHWQTGFHWPGMNWEIGVLTIYDGDLIAAGDSDAAGGTLAHHIARWDGDSWSPMGSGMQSIVLSFATHEGDLHVGGGFHAAGDKPSYYIARWVEEDPNSIPDDAGSGNQEALRLQPSSPKPFSSETRLVFSLREPGSVRLTVHDILGRRIVTLVDGFRMPAEHLRIWTGRGEDGDFLPNGVYFVRLGACTEIQTQKVILDR